MKKPSNPETKIGKKMNPKMIRKELRSANFFMQQSSEIKITVNSIGKIELTINN